jgi:hypothetical protein
MRRRSGVIAAAAVVTAIAVAPSAAQAATHTATCQGSSKRCTATFPLRGTHTGDRLVVRLPDTDLQLRSITPSAQALTSKYGFGGFSSSLGGSLLTARLLRFGAVPRTAKIAFTFTVPPDMKVCGDVPITVAGSKLVVQDLQAHGLSCAAARRVASQCIGATGPDGATWTIFRVDDLVTLRSGSRRVSFVAGKAGATCVPVG